MRVTAGVVACCVTVVVSARSIEADQRSAFNRPTSLRDTAAAHAIALAQTPDIGRLSTSRGSKAATGILIVGGLLLAVGVALMSTALAKVNCEDDPPEGSNINNCGTDLAVGVGLTSGGGSFLLGALPFRPRGSDGPKVIGSVQPDSSTTEIQNKTDYTIRVTFEGAAPQTHTVAPNQAIIVTLAPGQYQQTVETVDANAVAYRALQTYDSGVAYREQYYLRQ
jgi:hypothetical protein